MESINRDTIRKLRLKLNELFDNSAIIKKKVPNRVIDTEMLVTVLMNFQNNSSQILLKGLLEFNPINLNHYLFLRTYPFVIKTVVYDQLYRKEFHNLYYSIIIYYLIYGKDRTYLYLRKNIFKHNMSLSASNLKSSIKVGILP